MIYYLSFPNGPILGGILLRIPLVTVVTRLFKSPTAELVRLENVVSRLFLAEERFNLLADGDCTLN